MATDDENDQSDFAARRVQDEEEGDLLLEKYILETLLVEPSRWSELSTPAISQQIKIKHIQSLFMGLEERSMSDPLDAVALKYRDSLEEPLQEALDFIFLTLPPTDSSILLTAIRNFATEQLCSGNWSANAILKEYLLYSAPELEECSWFVESFPDVLELRHSYALYHKLRIVISS